MRLLAVVMLLVFSGAAFGDAPMKVKTKKKDHHHYHERDGYRHDRRHAHSHTKSGHKTYRRNRDVRFKDWGVWINWNSPGIYFNQRRYEGHQYNRRPGVHDYRSSDWITARSFNAGARHDREQVIHIDARVSAISLRGRHRDASVYRAYAELRNGRIIPLHALEGHVARGKKKGRYFYFDRPRYVERVFLTIDSAHRHKSAELALRYVESDRGYR